MDAGAVRRVDREQVADRPAVGGDADECRPDREPVLQQVRIGLSEVAL